MEINTLLDSPNQFILLVVVLTTILTLVLLTNRLVDLYYGKLKARHRQPAREHAKRHIEHLSTITVIQLGVAGLILVRILLSAWHIAYPWFDVVIIAIFLFLSGYWTWIHTRDFKDYYRFKTWYYWIKAKVAKLLRRHSPASHKG